MHMQTVVTFLHVALSPGILRRELELKVGMSGSSAHRNVSLLADGDPSRNQEGMGLIFKESDPLDSRQNRFYLTKEGSRLVDAIERTLATE